MEYREPSPFPANLRRLLRRSIPAATLCAALSLFWASGALADAPYTVEVCTPSSTAADGLHFVPANGQGFQFQPCGNPSNGGVGLAVVSPGSGHSQWVLESPAGARIHDVDANRAFEAWNHAAEWILSSAGGTGKGFEKVLAASAPPPNEIIHFPVGGAALIATLQCSGLCKEAGSSVVTMKDVVAHMEDLRPPEELALTGGSLKRGTVRIPFEADDRGSGIAKATLLIDGHERASVTDDNEGRCTEPYKFMIPCKTQIKSSFSLDTSGLSRGSHEAKLVVEDASGQVTTATAGIAIAQPDTTPPVLSKISLSRRRFQVAARAGNATGRKRSARGTVLRLTSSEAARLSITIERTRRARKAKPVGKLSANVGPGSTRVAVRGRIGAKQKPLRAGAYRMAIAATDAAGNVSKTFHRPFRVLPG
jgi:hypothetical protein